MHIIGTTGEGKSKLFEYLIREDIKKGNGLIFFDPSDRAETAYNVLKYCAKIGYDKVVLIDPYHRYAFNKVPVFNPLSYPGGVANTLDTFRVLFNVKDATETARIQRYLTAILSVLKEAKLSLFDSIYFTDRDNPIYFKRRQKILSHSHALDRHRVALDEVFTTRSMFLNELQSTVRRLEPVFQETLGLMYSQNGINFTELIAKKYVIIVNLYSALEFQAIHSRLLGISLINEIISSLDRLRNRGWEGVYYLYLDEAGRFANRALADSLSYKRKSGLRVALAHQYFKQFEDPYILDAILNLTKIKVMFQLPGREDRDKITKMFYGGDISDRDASFNNSNIPKQYAVIKVNKNLPCRVMIPDVETPNIDLKPYIEKIYQQPFYHHPKDLLNQINERFKDNSNEAGRSDRFRENPISTQPRNKPHKRPANKRDERKIPDSHESPGTPRKAEASQKETPRPWDSLFLEPPDKDTGQ